MFELIALNGIIVSGENAKISVKDRGLLFGDSIFETMVAFAGNIIAIENHLDRMQASLENLKINTGLTRQQIKDEITSIVSHKKMDKALVRYMITRGEGFGLKIQESFTANRILYCYPAQIQPSQLYSQGIKLELKNQGTTNRNHQDKTPQYLQSIMAIHSAEKNGFQDVLWRNSEGEVTESSTSNIFFIGRIENEVVISTPSLKSGLLSGITRANIIKLLTKAGIASHESIIHYQDLAQFDEAFVCSTVRGLVPVTQISNQKLFTTRKNSTFRHIERLYLAWIESQIGRKVDWNSGKPIVDHGQKILN